MNTPDTSFETHESCKVGDWFAIGCVFAPALIPHNDTIIAGLRTFNCIDVYSHYIMEHGTLQKRPTYVPAKDILAFATHVMTKHGMPHKGFVILKSVFLSSEDLAADPETECQGTFLRQINCSFETMPQVDRNLIKSRLEIVNLLCYFNGIPRIELVNTEFFLELQKVKY